MTSTAASRPGVRPAIGSRATRMRPRTLALAFVALTIVGFAGFTGYAAAVGSESLLYPEKSEDCRTPSSAYGWTYEAVNYDLASDAGLRPIPPEKPAGPWGCEGRPVGEGDAVVTSDGIRLAGWYIPSASGTDATAPTVVLVPGMSSNKSDYLRYAVPLHEAYNVAIFDLRGTGQSGDAPMTFGVTEQRDVVAALDWLMAAKHPTWVATIGTSAGGSTALVAAVGDTRIRALVLDSMHARISTGVGRAIERDKHLPAFPAQAAAFLGAWIRTGIDLGSVDPVDTIGRIQDRPILLTHGSVDEYDRPEESLEVNLRAAEAAGVDVEALVCQGAGHDLVIDTCTTQWTEWVTRFLEDARVADEGRTGSTRG